MPALPSAPCGDKQEPYGFHSVLYAATRCAVASDADAVGAIGCTGHK
jgi:hypothetical protein